MIIPSVLGLMLKYSRDFTMNKTLRSLGATATIQVWINMRLIEMWTHQKRLRLWLLQPGLRGAQSPIRSIPTRESTSQNLFLVFSTRNHEIHTVQEIKLSKFPRRTCLVSDIRYLKLLKIFISNKICQLNFKKWNFNVKVR